MGTSDASSGDRLSVSTDVHVPPQEVYDFLVDFPQYAQYSEYLTGVTQHGDGTPQTEYELDLAWWKLSYTARSRVTDLDPPTRIDWEIIEDLDAAGRWVVEPLDSPEDDVASRVGLVVEVDPSSADGTIDLPAFVTVDWIKEKVKPKLLAEAEQVVERIVADLEGQHREVELRIHETPL